MSFGGGEKDSEFFEIFSRAFPLVWSPELFLGREEDEVFHFTPKTMVK